MDKKMSIELPSVEEFLREQEEQRQKEELAKHLLNLQNSIYVNAGLNAKDVKSIARETKFDLSTPQGFSQSQNFIQSIKDKVEGHLNKILGIDWTGDDFEELVFYYKYFRVELLLVLELLERQTTETRDLIRDNQRLEAIAKPRLDGLEKYRQEIRQQERQRAQTLAEKALSGIVPEPRLSTIATVRFKKIWETEGGK